MSVKKKQSIVPALLITIGIIAAVSIAGSLLMQSKPLFWQGEVEAQEIRVSGKIPGRIAKFYVEEGSIVREGDTLVVISSPEIEAKLQQASAVEKAADAQNKKALNGARKQQIDAAYEQWQRAEAGAEIASKTYSRVNKLFEKSVVSTQKRDEAEAALKAAEALAKAAKAQYNLAVEGAQAEDKAAAHALLSQAQGAVNEVQAYLRETCLLAPASGEISDVFPKRGELVGSGSPIMNILDVNDVWVVFSIREDKLSEIQKGSVFTAIVPALGDKEINLKITSIKALGSYATWKATKVSGDFDLKTFEIKARPTEHIDGLRPGMSVRVKV